MLKRYLLFFAFVLSSMILIAQTRTQINLGIDWFGTHTIDNYDFDSNPGFFPSIEIMKQYAPACLIGVGLEYQLGRGLTDIASDAKYGFVPIYMVGKIAFNEGKSITPELIVNGGYDFMTGSEAYSGDYGLHGGVYWGVGLGINYIQGFTMQVMYRSFEGRAIGHGESDRISQHNPSLLLGWRF